MPVTRATSSKQQTKNTYQRNKRNIPVNDSNVPSSSSQTTETNQKNFSQKKQKTFTLPNEDDIDPEIENIIMNVMSTDNKEPLFEQKTDKNISSTEVPLEMDIDTTSSNTPLQTSLSKQTANDSMHAQPKNDNMFE